MYKLQKFLRKITVRYSSPMNQKCFSTNTNIRIDNGIHLYSRTGFANRTDECVYLHIERGVRSDHEWSLETHVEKHSNARCELMH